MEKIKNAVDQLKPQFHVEHRIKEVFDNPEIRSFSLGMAAEQVSRSEQKLDKTLQSLVLCDILETRSDDPAESTENLLGDLHYRVNDTLLASCNASGLLTPGDHSREPSRSRASSPSFRLPSGLLTPGDHSREPSRSRPSSPSVHRNSEGHEGRRGTRPTGSSFKTAKGKERWHSSAGAGESAVEALLDSDYLYKLQEKIEKASVSSPHEQSKMEGKRTGSVRRGRSTHKTKGGSKKKATAGGNSSSDEDSESKVFLDAQKVRTKLASVKNFKEATK